MLTDISGTTTLSNGVKMPVLGLGTWKSPAGQVENAIKWAVDAGYRHIDTAAAYGNEDAIGKVLPQLPVARKDLFITTKLWNDVQRQGSADAVLKAFDESLAKLGTDYVDLYLIHWPVKEHFKNSWRVMERLYSEKRARAIGVSNFLIHHLKDLMADAQVVPQVNQVEFHPLLRQQELLDFCRQHKIQHEAWSPLMQGNAGTIEPLRRIGAKYAKSPEQVALRWELQKNSVVIPKSTNRERIAANGAIFDFGLTREEVAEIDRLDQGKRFGSHPDTFTF